MINNILISRTTLQKRVQPVHVVHISPEMHQSLGDLKIREIFAGHPDVLKPWHKLAIETAHRVACEETSALTAQMLVDFA